MSQLGLFDAKPATGDPGLADLFRRWRDAVAAYDRIPVKDREARIEADTDAFDIERAIVDSLEGRTPCVVLYEGNHYILARSMVLKATLIDLEAE